MPRKALRRDRIWSTGKWRSSFIAKAERFRFSLVHSSALKFHWFFFFFFAETCCEHLVAEICLEGQGNCGKEANRSRWQCCLRGSGAWLHPFCIFWQVAGPLDSLVPSPTLIFTSWGAFWWNGEPWIDVREKSLFLLRHQKQNKVAPVALNTFNGCYLLTDGVSAAIITVSHVQKKPIFDNLIDIFTRLLYFHSTSVLRVHRQTAQWCDWLAASMLVIALLFLWKR